MSASSDRCGFDTGDCSLQASIDLESRADRMNWF